MALNAYDVIVVSVEGRGHWLAAELRKERLTVLLIDVTKSLGVWPPEDREGPFGVFRVEGFAESFLERLAHDDATENVANGFCFWPRSGPLELKGPLTHYQWSRQGFDETWLERLSHGEKPAAASTSDGVLKAWPAALAQQLASTIQRPAYRALEAGRPLPIAATFGVRFATRAGLVKSLDWLRSLDVAVADDLEILDLSFKARREISGLEVKGSRTADGKKAAGAPSGVITCDQMIWTLTGGETRFLSDRLAEHLYPKGIAEPEWCWVRYRLDVRESAELAVLPLHVVMIDDLESPWTHSNVVVLQKTPSPRALDAWIRIPALQRFNKGYLEEHGRRILTQLGSRLSGIEATVQSLPQEASYTSQELGEPRVPVWAEGSRPDKGRRKAMNLHFENAENRASYGIDEQFDHQRRLRDQILNWWQLKQQRLEKEKKA